MIRSDKLQRIAEIVMVLGIVALCQPWNFFLHRYGLTIIIIGLVTFLLTNWFGSKVVPEDAEAPGKEGHS
jgi:disulfide bond formation protein DsbB